MAVVGRPEPVQQLAAIGVAVLAVWCAAGFTASYAAMNRRG